MKRIIATCAVLAMGGAAACGSAPSATRADGSTGVTNESLLGDDLFDSSCRDSAKKHLLVGVEYGRFATSSAAFRECVTTAMILNTNAGRGEITIGPYNRCAGDPQPTSIDTVLGLTRSTNDLLLRCDYSTGALTGNASAYSGDVNGANQETFTFANVLNDLLSDKPNCNENGGVQPCVGDGTYFQIASDTWHEVMHDHGYGHTEGTDLCGIPADQHPSYANSVPYIVSECVNSVLRQSNDHCAIHSCGPDSLSLVDSVYSFAPSCTCVGEGKSGWHAPYPTPSAGSALVAGGQLAGTVRNGVVDLWTIGADGSLWNGANWDGAWHAGYKAPIATLGVLVAGGGIGANSRTSGMNDTWAIGRDGALYNAGYWNGSWHDGYRAPLRTLGTLVAGGGIAAVSRTSSMVDTWTIGRDGALYNAGYWNGSWHDGYRAPLRTLGTLVAGGGIAANARTPGMVDTWTIGTDGALWNAGYWDGNWHDGYRVPLAINGFTPGAPIAAVSRDSGIVDTYVIGNDGSLWNAGWWNGAWHPGYRVTATPNGSFPRSAGIAVVSRDPLFADTYAIGGDGTVWNAGWWHP